jgi:translation initiation factor 2B subunit (eIF-2B alpha/beta/delta family)
MDPAELSPGQPPLGPHVRVRNIYFDRTPARLISGWIDEHGIRLNESRAS